MKSKYFRIEELVPKHIYEKRGDKAWELIDYGIILTIDKLKTIFPNGTITINNWVWNGDRQWSGLRTPESPYYSSTSQHSYGRAVDILFSAYDNQEVAQYVLDNPSEFPFIKGVERGVSWCHLDCRNRESVLEFTA